VKYLTVEPMAVFFMVNWLAINVIVAGVEGLPGKLPLTTPCREKIVPLTLYPKNW
jgi:hypothetical protein